LPRSVKTSELIRQVNQQISREIPELIGKLFELAAGVQVKGDDGEPAYSRPPDRMAIEYLMNRVLGKPAGGSSGITINEVNPTERSIMIVLPDNSRDPARLTVSKPACEPPSLGPASELAYPAIPLEERQIVKAAKGKKLEGVSNVKIKPAVGKSTPNNSASSGASKRLPIHKK